MNIDTLKKQHTAKFSSLYKNITLNPVDLLIDGSIRGFISIIFPNPFISLPISEIAIRNKSKIFALIMGVVLTIILIFSGFATSLTYGDTTTTGSSSNPDSPLPFLYPDSLKGYIEEGYSDTSVPKGSPLGGVGMKFSIITAFYHDPIYYLQFGWVHNGIDIVPSEYYYKYSKSYLLYNKNNIQRARIIVLATLSGKACSSGSVEKGYKVEIYSRDGQYKTLYLHNEVNFIPLDTCIDINAGQPIAVQGQTGKATGIHSHYMVYIPNGNNGWTDINPYPYLISQVHE